MASDPHPTLTKAEMIRRAHAAGEGGYTTLARRFSMSRDAVRVYLGKKTSPSLERSRQVRLCARKARYATRDDALAGLASMRRAETWRDCDPDFPLGVYSCPACGGWHVGHDRRTTPEAHNAE